jgi:hypothetical protein
MGGSVRASDALGPVMQPIRGKGLAQRWAEQADTLHREGKLPEALTLYKRVLKLTPPRAIATLMLYRIAVISWQIQEPEAALRILAPLVAQNPTFVEAHHLLGVIHETRGEYTQAVAAYETALKLNPQLGDVWEGLGKCVHAFGDAELAIHCLEKAIALAPASGPVTAERRYNLSYPLMALGRWTEGWAAYEARFDSPVFMGTYVMRHHEPMWDGAPLNGKRLLVHAEQGFGDSIMMARYVPLIEGDVHIEVQRPLGRLFEQSFPGYGLSAQGEAHPPCDLQVAMMSLPHRFGMTAENVPTVPWLAPAIWPNHGRELRETGGAPTIPKGDGLKVGFVWAGSPDHRSDKRRSIALEHWKPLWSIPGVTWYSLQVDQEPVSVPCHNLKPLITDFADTAALISQLDLVISCDTSVAHLAGALGKPLWLLLPTIPDYRWGVQGETTPWYPTARLVRQPAQGDWGSVMREVKAALEALTQQEAA